MSKVVSARAIPCVVVAAGLALLPRVALANPRVLLVSPTKPDRVLSEAFHRLRAELSLKGFEVQTVELDASDGRPEALEEVATKEGAVAGIALTRRANTAVADVCIADRITGKTSIRTLELREGSEAPSVLAVRASDLLRSSLGEFGPTEKPPPDVANVDPQPVPEVVTRFASPPPARFRIEAGAAILGVGQGIGLAYAPGLAVGYELFERVGIGLSFTGPALGAAYDTADGVAVITQELGLARAWVTAWRREAFEIRAVAEAGAYHLDAHGDVAPPFASRSAEVWSLAAGLGLELDTRLSTRIVWQIEGSALMLAPIPSVALLSNAVVFGWPFSMLATGVGVDF